MAAGLFSNELRVFQEHRDEWLRTKAGKFVVIQDSVVAEGFLIHTPRHSRLAFRRSVSIVTSS